MFILFRGLRKFSGAEAQRLACGSAWFRNSSAPADHRRRHPWRHRQARFDPDVWAQAEALIRQQIQSTTMK
jgi:hypothetical protein